MLELEYRRDRMCQPVHEALRLAEAELAGWQRIRAGIRMGAMVIVSARNEAANVM